MSVNWKCVYLLQAATYAKRIGVNIDEFDD